MTANPSASPVAPNLDWSNMGVLRIYLMLITPKIDLDFKDIQELAEANVIRFLSTAVVDGGHLLLSKNTRQYYCKPSPDHV